MDIIMAVLCIPEKNAEAGYSKAWAATLAFAVVAVNVMQTIGR